MATETEKKDEKRYEKASDFTPEEKTLLTLKGELYYGSWEIFIKDLKDRLQGRPYIFKLANRIGEDLERIDAMQRYEIKNSVNLSDIVKIEDSTEDTSKKEN